ncbi:efflux RND transporter periplasmic adaptor subunit, partial [Vibrio parahaemolyticus]|nr:efflux RND transporter periplasmic adaptor subunit [Vibrio parahaemolyticus]
GNAYLLSKSAGATKIPNSALLVENGKTYVWRVDEQGIVSKAAIEMNDKNQVLAGLNDGDQIIISGVSVIEPGIKVRAWIKERGL